MTLLWILFGIATVILFAVHALSSSQLYKQRGLGPHANSSIIIFAVLWGIGFLSLVINLIAYTASST